MGNSYWASLRLADELWSWPVPSSYTDNWLEGQPDGCCPSVDGLHIINGKDEWNGVDKEQNATVVCKYKSKFVD